MRNGSDSESGHDVPVRRRPGIFLVPNLLTTGGIFAGFFSIVAAIDGNFETAAWATIVAFLLDGMDGRVARLTNTESDFGKEYDSLADMVSFGVAPAIITYQWGVARLAEYGVVWGRLGWLATFLFAVAAAFRLARFNTTTEKIDKRFFEGVPSPPAAVAVVSMVWLASTYELSGLVGLVAGICVTAVVGVLMVSRFRYRSFKNVSLSRRVKFANLLLIPLGLILISLAPPIVIFALAITYVGSGPVSWILRYRRQRAAQTQPITASDEASEAKIDRLGNGGGSGRHASDVPDDGKAAQRAGDDG
ncbi:MAG TPA: CDP-diacylglycerol--serine O-phosphatidyltransferase [Gammaproteobacteria bacterium]|nr:CDP-diacylglycerol--serine O-phosphatidyltransferase [Gammaproteobacteria bacterium]